MIAERESYWGLNYYTMLFLPTSTRYPFFRVTAITFLASACLLVFVYVYRLALNQPFNWVAYNEYLPNQLIGTVATAVFYYLFLNEFHGLFHDKRNARYFVMPGILGILSIQLYNLIVDRVLPLTSNINDPISLERQVLGHFLVGIFYVATVLLIAYINNLREVRKHNKLLEEQKLKLKIEKMQAELKFLKSQISPHFLHNTLNSFYARSLPFSKDLANGILTLSEMMRYALEETNRVDGNVFLTDEITHVRNLIKLNQFRFRNSLQIEMEVKGVLNGYVVIPFLLITLVENIFKHGDLSTTAPPIIILVEIDNGKLRYYSENKRKAGPKQLSAGIGLDNINKRLNITYGNGYELNITENDDYYSIELMINKL